MGYWIYLRDGGEEGETVQVQSFIAGGIVRASIEPTSGVVTPVSQTDAEISVTWNYNVHYGKIFDKSLRELLADRRAGDTIEELQRGVDELGTERSDDYWEATPGNAGYILELFLEWAVQHPDAIWVVH